MATTVAKQSSLPVEDPAPAHSLKDLLFYFLRLGTFGFGGPIATVGYMQRDLVEQRRWVSERDFLDGIALGQTMPGPLAAQVVMWVGFLRARSLGALFTAGAFVLPSFLFVLSLSYVYVRYEGLGLVQQLFHGIAPAAMAIIALAAVKLARTTNRKEWKLWMVSAVLLAVTALTETEIAFLFVGAGFLLVLIEAPPRVPFLNGKALAVGATGHGLLMGTAALGTQGQLLFFFLKAGAFIFGSGLAIVPFLHAGVVEDHGWLTENEFLDAVAVGLITPGPVVITATFIGYLVGGLVGALVATVAIFLPIYLGVIVPGPWYVRHRDNPQVRAFVRGATAAAAGAIGGATIILTRQAVDDTVSAAIAITALALVWRFKAPEPVVVVGAAVAGVAFY